MYPYCFYKDKVRRSDKPLVNINDISILRGFAAFDFFRIYDGEPFCFDEHFERFTNTAREMGLKVPYSKKKIKQFLDQLIVKNGNKNYHVRFVLSGGETKKGIMPSTPILSIILEKMKDLPKETYTRGAKIITNDFKRTLPTSKTSEYLNAVLLQKHKESQNALEILYTNKNIVLECSTSNMFLIKNGVVITPATDILKGITRKKVLDLAIQNNFKYKERRVRYSELLSADEVFITATNKKIVPIVEIDNHIISDKKVGDITKVFIKEYNNLITKEKP